MRPLSHSLLRLSLVTALLSTHAFADSWTAPTPEELSMTSQPQVPGAAAVYLFREETTEDKLHMFSVYVRLKVLNEGGKSSGTSSSSTPPGIKQPSTSATSRAAPFTPTAPSSPSPASPMRS